MRAARLRAGRSGHGHGQHQQHDRGRERLRLVAQQVDPQGADHHESTPDGGDGGQNRRDVEQPRQDDAKTAEDLESRDGLDLGVGEVTCPGHVRVRQQLGAGRGQLASPRAEKGGAEGGGQDPSENGHGGSPSVGAGPGVARRPPARAGLTRL